MRNIRNGISMIALVAALAACAAQSEERATVEIIVPADTRLQVRLDNGVGTEVSSPGDRFEGTLAAPLLVDGMPAFGEGTRVTGIVTDVDKGGRVQGRATIGLELRSIEDADSRQTVPLETRTYVAVAASGRKDDAKAIAGGTGVGALVGVLAGGGKGAAVGAAIGAGGATGAVLATRGKDIHYGPGTTLQFRLSSSLTLQRQSPTT